MLSLNAWGYHGWILGFGDEEISSTDCCRELVVSVQFLRTDSVPNKLFILSRDRTQLVKCESVFLRCLSIAFLQPVP